MKTFLHFLLEFLTTIVIAIIIFIAFRFSLQTFVVVMSSMEPNFYEGQRLLVNKATYHFGEPEIGDVIIFKAPNGRKGDYIKRVIGLPGDTIEIKDKAVYVNGSALDEPYIASPPRYTMQEIKVPENSYFVLGDNRNNSDDSHYDWFVPSDDIIGKAWLSIWPPTAWKVVPDYHSLNKQLVSFLTSDTTKVTAELWERQPRLA